MSSASSTADSWPRSTSSSSCRRRARTAWARSCSRRRKPRSPRGAACGCSCSFQWATLRRVTSTSTAATAPARAIGCSTRPYTDGRAARVAPRNGVVMPAVNPALPRACLLAAFLTLGALAAAGAKADIYDAAVAHAGRSAEDLKRDAIDHPAEVLRLSGIGPGMRVGDLLAAGGYYSELLSFIVGSRGEVLML